MLGYNDSGNTETDDTDVGALLIRGYDSTDRMVSIDDGAGTAFTYLHNALGQRVAKAKTGGGTTHYLYDLSGQLIAEASGSTGSNLVEYIWLDGMPLAYVKAGVVYRIHTDHLGTPRKLTHPDGTEAWSAVLRPFGGEDAVGGDVNFNLRFPGQYFDTEFDLHYNYHRNYDPNTGRYFESDPIGLQGGWNTYGYVGGNPVRLVDPSGLQEGATACLLGPPGCVGGAVYEAAKWTVAICVGVAGGIALSEGIDAANNAIPLPQSTAKARSCTPAPANDNLPGRRGNCPNDLCNLKQKIDLGTPTPTELTGLSPSSRKWRCIYDCGSLGIRKYPDDLINVIGCPARLPAIDLVPYP